MDIQGLQKLTLLDYPGKVACTVFLAGCNFRCPFCHNAGLVLAPESEPLIDNFHLSLPLSLLFRTQKVIQIFSSRKRTVPAKCSHT